MNLLLISFQKSKIYLANTNPTFVFSFYIYYLVLAATQIRTKRLSRFNFLFAKHIVETHLHIKVNNFYYV